MATKSWTLLDAAKETYLEKLSLGPDDVPDSPTGWSVTKRRLHGGLSDGVDVVEINNGSLQFTVIPTRGMSIQRGRIGSRLLGWNSPTQGPVHPAFVPNDAPDGLGWLDGFDELLVRCGLESNGAPEFDEAGRLKYALHGRIANLPANRVVLTVDTAAQTISLTGLVYECRLFFRKLQLQATITTHFGEAGLAVHDEVTNLSHSPTAIQLLYHINFGPPTLEAGSRLITPVKTVVPNNATSAEGVATWNRYEAPKSGLPEQVYFCDPLADAAGQTTAVLTDAAGDQGVGVSYQPSQLPCFTLWKCRLPDGDGFVTGLEPATNFPNTRSFEERHGRVVPLGPGETKKFDVGITVYETADQVAEAERRIADVQAGNKTDVRSEPREDWCG